MVNNYKEDEDYSSYYIRDSFCNFILNNDSNMKSHSRGIVSLFSNNFFPNSDSDRIEQYIKLLKDLRNKIACMDRIINDEGCKLYMLYNELVKKECSEVMGGDSETGRMFSDIRNELLSFIYLYIFDSKRLNKLTINDILLKSEITFLNNNDIRIDKRPVTINLINLSNKNSTVALARVMSSGFCRFNLVQTEFNAKYINKLNNYEYVDVSYYISNSISNFQIESDVPWISKDELLKYHNTLVIYDGDKNVLTKYRPLIRGNVLYYDTSKSSYSGSSKVLDIDDKKVNNPCV